MVQIDNIRDIAKFEVCAHKFVDYSEHGFGCALLNDCKYGFSVKDDTVRMSIVRAAKSPDDRQDIGRHTFKYALMPHKGTFMESNVVAAGYDFNVPLVAKLSSATNGWGSLFKIDKENLIIDTVKLAEDQSGAVVVRIFEAYGGRGTATILSDFFIVSACISNVLEEAGETLTVKKNELKIAFKPFQLITILMKLSQK
jgi:alpha-mannosidase